MPGKQAPKSMNTSVKPSSASGERAPLQLDTNILDIVERAKAVIDRMETIITSLNPLNVVKDEIKKVPKKKAGKKEETEDEVKQNDNFKSVNEQVCLQF